MASHLLQSRLSLFDCRRFLFPSPPPRSSTTFYYFLFTATRRCWLRFLESFGGQLIIESSWNRGNQNWPVDELRDDSVERDRKLTQKNCFFSSFFFF